MSGAIEARVRQVLAQHARLPVEIDAVSEHDDLFQLGMSSHASISVMLGLEDAFDVEFPDDMLKRSLFESISAISEALRTLHADVPA